MTQYKSKDSALRILAATLAKVGSEKSIPALKEIVATSKNQDTIYSAVRALDILNGGDGLELD